MSETNNKGKQTPQPAGAKATARPAKKTYSKEVKERARKIEVARKNEKAKIASEERKVRMARRAEDKKKAEEVKKAKTARQKAAVAETSATPSSVTVKVAVEPEFVDFAVTARKYKTQLTRKFKERKFWVDPSPYEILSYIPGTIISVDVKEGKVVDEGTQLLVLEAMKMQNRVDMPFKARIKKVNVKAGEKIPKDFVMIELEAIEK